ncbi:MAG: system NifU family Fe-S cluster assembly protein, partial [Fibrobacteres bacterium]|nr:system NifU family Fe-S cluster assembly protein [Fibrobacterota bacterium]
GKLTLFEGVKEYSSRIKCASLAWHALMGALEKKPSATTEG